MKIPYWRTSLGDAEAQRVAECIKNETLSQGIVTQQFEEQFAKAVNASYAIATTSGSVALLLSLMALGIKAGDEVLVPDLTFIATAHAAMMLGAKVVLVDTLPNLPVMDTSLIKSKITPRTKAIMPVHLNGHSVNMREINQFAKEYGLIVVEDACQAMFSKNKDGNVGTQSNAGCFSLGVMKMITTAQGGMVVTHDKALYEKLKLIRSHGVAATFEDATYQQLGFNFRYTDILAGIGLEQLKRATQRIDHVNQIYRKYKEGFAGFKDVKILDLRIEDGEIPLYVEMECADRKAVRQFFDSHDIQTRYAYPPLDISGHLQCHGDFTNAHALSERILNLPCGPEQPIGNIDRVIEVFQKYYPH